jgi:hypothetical protein
MSFSSLMILLHLTKSDLFLHENFYFRPRKHQKLRTIMNMSTLAPWVHTAEDAPQLFGLDPACRSQLSSPF